ncbi:hypothetical protein [Aeromonas phage AerS_266]|nr:hypothetical protein [Aeromonas phage AerS_266]
METLYGIEIKENPIVKALVDTMNPELYTKIENVGEKKLAGIFNGLEYRVTLTRVTGSFLMVGFIHSDNITISKARGEAAVLHAGIQGIGLKSVKQIFDWSNVDNVRDDIEEYFLKDFKTQGYPISVIVNWCINNQCVTRGLVKALKMLDMEISDKSSETTLVIKGKDKIGHFNFNATTTTDICNFFIK